MAQQNSITGGVAAFTKVLWALVRGSTGTAEALESTGGALHTIIDSGAVTATTSGPNATSRIVSSAATTNATSAKASAAKLFGLQGYNANAAVRYLKLYDKATAPVVGTDVPVKTLALPPTAAFAFDFVGYDFAVGLAYALTTGAADADVGAVAAGDILGLNVDYR